MNEALVENAKHDVHCHDRGNDEKDFIEQRGLECGSGTLERGGEADRQAEFALEQSVDRALGTLRQAHARVAALATAAAQFDEVVRIRRLSLQTGSGTQTDYLDAETDLLRARASLVEARHAEIAARVELARVAGELTPEWLAAALDTAPRTDAPTHGRTEGAR